MTIDDRKGSITMQSGPRRQLILTLPRATDPTIAQWLSAMQDARARTLESLEEVDERALDWQRDNENTVGTLLYHVAAIEADWLFAEVLTQPFPDDVVTLLSSSVRDVAGRLTSISEWSIADHLTLLAEIRARLIATFESMTFDDFVRPRALPEYDVTPVWVLHHLMQHEAEHRGQIQVLLAAYRNQPA